MNSPRALSAHRRHTRGATVLGAAVLTTALLTTLGFASTATAQEVSPAAVAPVVINPGGGVLTDGSDGLQLSVGLTAGLFGSRDGHKARNQTQWCCGPTSTGGGPLLAIGTASVGNGSMTGGASWDSITLLGSSGSASTSGGAATGSGSATIRYDYTLGGRLYRIDRTVSYTYPNNSATDTYVVTIPEGNTAAVKLYYGGDTQPGGSDQGYGVMLTAPRRSVISLNTASHTMFGFSEAAGSVPFTGARSEDLGAYGTNSAMAAVTGGDIGFTAQAADHDASLAVQWDLGSTPGTVTAGMETFVAPQGVNLTGGFHDGSGDPGVPETLDLSIVNTNLSNATGIGFGFTLPSGVVVASGSPNSTCGGTLTAAAGGSTITLAGGSVSQTSNCVIGVPVVAAAAGSYSLTSAAVTSTTGLDNGIGTSTLAVAGPVSSPSGLVGLSPARLVDTRSTGNPLAGDEVREIVVAGQGGVPADATAVVVNATVVDAVSNGYLTLFPCGSSVPATSTLNFPATSATSNAATIGLGAGGTLCARSTTAANLVLDVTAAHSPTHGSSRIVGLSPERLVDTRSGAKISGGTVYEVIVAGRGGVPADATSAALNVTVVDPSGDGYATIYPCGTATPASSNINFGTAQTVANSAIIGLGTDGKVCIVASADAHFVIDANAAFSPTGTGGPFTALAPTRLADSRPTPVAGGTAYEISVAGNGGVPTGATIAALNITIDAPSSDGYATVYPCGGVAPLASNLNFRSGQTVANAVTVGLGTAGKVCVMTTADAAVVVDVAGYYATPT